MRNAPALPGCERKEAPSHPRWERGLVFRFLRHFGSIPCFARRVPVPGSLRFVRLRAISSNRRCRLRANARSRAGDRVVALAVLVAWAFALLHKVLIIAIWL